MCLGHSQLMVDERRLYKSGVGVEQIERGHLLYTFNQGFRVLWCPYQAQVMFY